VRLASTISHRWTTPQEQQAVNNTYNDDGCIIACVCVCVWLFRRCGWWWCHKRSHRSQPTYNTVASNYI